MITVNSDRLWSRIEALSRFTDPAKPWTRRAFDSQFAQGRAWLADEFKAAGLAVEVDVGGNLIGRTPGTGRSLGALVAGSHSDTVPAGGRFDGMLGLLAALEAAQSIREQKVSLVHPLEVCSWDRFPCAPASVRQCLRYSSSRTWRHQVFQLSSTAG